MWRHRGCKGMARDIKTPLDFDGAARSLQGRGCRPAVLPASGGRVAANPDQVMNRDAHLAVRIAAVPFLVVFRAPERRGAGFADLPRRAAAVAIMLAHIPFATAAAVQHAAATSVMVVTDFG
jgi:hypothetical protein